MTPLATDLGRVLAARMTFAGQIDMRWDRNLDWIVSDYLLMFQP